MTVVTAVSACSSSDAGFTPDTGFSPVPTSSSSPGSTSSPDPTATPALDPTSSPGTISTPTPNNEGPTAVPTVDIDTLLVAALGGDTTVFQSRGDAYFYPIANLANRNLLNYEIGQSLFHENWTPATGLGPLFNATACSSCHIDHGRGQPPASLNQPAQGLLLRMTVPGPSGQIEEPTYGGQLQDAALEGLDPEGFIHIQEVEINGRFADGTPYTLIQPTYSVTNLRYGTLNPETLFSPRVPQALIGMGLLEAIPEEVILAMADPDDSDGDGISGRPNMVPDFSIGQMALGRFGWKAGQPTVEQQTAAAFRNDLGITSAFYPVEPCTSSQSECSTAAEELGQGLASDRISSTGFFTSLLAVPAMRNTDDPTVRRGAELFVATGCSACHVPSMTTGEHEIPELSNQVIYPFTDLLLHDMGDGLADGQEEFGANGREWRTPPLWGIGLVETVNGHTRFLHDGRARNLTEAILWHGGEAEQSRDMFKELSENDRSALIAFLRAL